MRRLPDRGGPVSPCLERAGFSGGRRARCRINNRRPTGCENLGGLLHVVTSHRLGREHGHDVRHRDFGIRQRWLSRRPRHELRRCGLCCRRRGTNAFRKFHRRQRDLLHRTHERIRVFQQHEQLPCCRCERAIPRLPSCIEGVSNLVDVDADAAQFVERLRVREHDALCHDRLGRFHGVGLRCLRRSRRFAARGFDQHAGGISARGRLRLDGGLPDGFLELDGKSHRQNGRRLALRYLRFTGSHVYVSPVYRLRSGERACAQRYRN